ncbi:sugar phosphate isomerase/epimerase family protein [Tautonia sociabilis]|uniref:Sugar phosphate isomerase/epimerase n=1 Tax=Tautonia sociabilis TaxID=2080755 RepID=A0A432MEG2_9BACT|nr:sugar phosphate isomerase/epimerase family protein [Tautonia sociabilis]RUL83786.1 sugar phosphate isomerase/epimerase [Tautonia sociabilis]
MIYLSAFADEISPDPTEQLDTLLMHSIRFVEFRSIFGINVLDLTDEQHEQFRSLLKERGMGLSAIGSPIGKIKADEPFEPHLERYEIALKLCDFYECPRIRVFSYYIPQGSSPADHRDEVLRRMAAKAEIAQQRGVTLMLENEKGIYGDTADRVKEILDAVHSPALAHAFDPANYLEVGQPIDKAWTMLRDRVAHFHVKDYDTKLKKNVPAGEGEGEIPRLIADAVSRGFEGYCVLEPHLLVAEASTGFTGPERFGDAAVALQTCLSREGVTYA